jgi:hypothetical protein
VFPQVIVPEWFAGAADFSQFDGFESSSQVEGVSRSIFMRFPKLLWLAGSTVTLE